MHAPGARRSAAPSYSPWSALTSQAIYDDQVTKDLLDAMLSAVQPTGVGQSQAGVNLGEVLGSGTSIADFNLNGGGWYDIGDSGGTAPTGGLAGLGVVGDIGQAFSALGFLGQNSTMAQLGKTLGQVATIGTAVGQAAQGNLGQAALTVAPMGLAALGVPGGLASVAVTAANPALGPVDTEAAALNAAIAKANPAAFAVLSLAQTMGLVPTTKSVLTPVENIDVNAMIAEQASLALAMEEAAAIAAGFDSDVSSSTVGVTGAESVSGDIGGTAADGGDSAGDGSGDSASSGDSGWYGDDSGYGDSGYGYDDSGGDSGGWYGGWYGGGGGDGTGYGGGW